MATEQLKKALHSVGEWERSHTGTSRIPAPVMAVDQRRRSLEDRLAGQITDFAGSMRFVYLHALWFLIWIAINAGLVVGSVLGITPFDPFPFGLLTLVVSLEAIFLSTFVMIAQNRQGAVADARAVADYQVNVRAEAEVARIRELLEALVEHHVLIQRASADVGLKSSPPADR